MRNIIIAAVISLLSSFAIATEISLLCRIQSNFTASNGETIKESGRAIIEVTDLPNLKMILILSDLADSNNLGVSNKLPPSMRGQASDFSTKSKWEIHNTIEKDDGRIINRIMIDRVTGIMVASTENNKNGRATMTNVSGDCRKNDANIRKF